MEKIAENNIKFNVFLGEQLNKISNSPTVQRISRELFSSKEVAFERSNSLLRNIQLLLDNIIYEKTEIIGKIIDIYKRENQLNTSFYKSLMDEEFISSVVYMNYDYMFEDNFSILIKKSTPFSINKSESFQIPFYKIFGDYKNFNKCVLSTQDLKKLKLLDFYCEFWSKLTKELESRETVLLGLDFGNDITIEILDFIFSKANRKYKQIYLYANTETQRELERKDVKNFIKKYSIKIIKGKNEDFLNVFKTFLFQSDVQNNKDKINGFLETKKDEKNEEVVSASEEETTSLEKFLEDSLESGEEKKLPIFEKEISKKIILREHIDFDKKRDKKIKIIDTEIQREVFLETKTEIDFKTFFLNKFPIRYKNFSINLVENQIINLGFVDIDFGFEKQNSMGVRIIDYPSFRLIEMKRRDFKISIGVDLNSSICLRANGYYEYEIYRGSKNSRLEWIFSFMMNLFKGCNIKFHSSNFICDLDFENYLELSKFETLYKIFKEYEPLTKVLKLTKNKNFSELENSFYQIHLLERNLKSSNYPSWINAKIKLSIDNIINEGDKLILKRTHRYNLKNLPYNLIENLSLVDPINESEIRDGYIILKRKVVEVELKKIYK